MTISLINAELGEEATLSSFRVNIVDFKGDNSYPTGGYSGVASKLGFQRILALIALSHAGVTWDYDPGTDKLKIYGQPAVAAAGRSPELPNGTDLSAVTFRALAIGA